MPLNLVFLGPPGAGKGTIASRVCQKLGISHIATGDLLRKEIGLGSKFGKKAGPIMNKGELVADKLVTEVLRKRLAEEKGEGFILDGYPRTLKQVDLLEDLLQELGVELDAVFYTHASEETIVERLGNRRQCSKCSTVYNLTTLPPKDASKCDKCGAELFQREDDKPELVRKRLQIYKEKTEPIIDYYSKNELLRKVDCNGSLEENMQNVYKLLEEFEASKD